MIMSGNGNTCNKEVNAKKAIMQFNGLYEKCKRLSLSCLYTPYRSISRCWIAGGNVDTCECHCVGSHSFKPLRISVNAWLSPCEGLVQRTMALQNHNRLCERRTGCQSTEIRAHQRLRYRPSKFLQGSLALTGTDLGKPSLSLRCHVCHAEQRTTLLQIH